MSSIHGPGYYMGTGSWSNTVIGSAKKGKVILEVDLESLKNQLEAVAETISQSMLKTFENRRKTCQICQKSNNDLTVTEIKCRHTFCMSCLESYVCPLNETTKVSCPVCDLQAGKECNLLREYYLNKLPSADFLKVRCFDSTQAVFILRVTGGKLNIRFLSLMKGRLCLLSNLNGPFLWHND